MADTEVAADAATPVVSLVVLAWDQLPLTRACVASLRATTDVPHEVVVVDNGSAPEAAAWARDHADVAVLHDENLGFAAGMNAGLEVARGEVVAFVNNDTVWPPGWTGPLLGHLLADEEVGIVVPAVTAAGNPFSVRDEPGQEVVRVDPFAALPSGVAYLLRTDVARALGGWTDRYELAMSEDLDLLFTTWANGLHVVLDTRVLVEHVLHATLDDADGLDRSALWRDNLDRFLAFWTATDGEGVGRLPSTDDDTFTAGLAHARAAAAWLARLDDARTEHREDRAALRGRIVKLEGDVAVLRERLAAARDRASLLTRLARRVRR